ncbi:MAG: exonuclease SbcCD subunit D [Clostridiales bacterium]|nr:exonuclease SbcCD subunit D [Clostridiales bacterium]
MKFIHLSDLHLGKRIYDFSMLEDQRHILGQILHSIDEFEPSAVIIAGDIYDKPVPSAQALGIFDDFLVELARRDLQVFIIGGNHDSSDRLSFGSRLIEASGIHLTPAYDGRAPLHVLQDEYGPVNIYMLPFLKPAEARQLFPDAEISDYNDAVRAATAAMMPDESERNILVTHQFVTGGLTSESEEMAVGGADNVDASVFEAFDYVALGHLHRPQHVGRETLRYCGSPLKYSFSEKDHEKSVTLVEMREKGDIEISTAPLLPLRDMREIRGSYLDVTFKENYENTDTDDYLRIVLTDEDEEPDAVLKLRLIYPNLMRLDYDNSRTRALGSPLEFEAEEGKDALELLEEFFEIQNGIEMSTEQREYSRRLFENIKEGGR